MPDRLLIQLRRLLQASPALARAFGPAPVDYDPDAARWLQRRRALLVPGTHAQCQHWMQDLRGGYNDVSDALASARAAAIWQVCGALPGIVWSPATVRAMWLAHSAFPTPGEAHRVLRQHVALLLAEIAALDRIATAPRAVRVVEAAPYVIPPAMTKPAMMALAGRHRDAPRRSVPLTPEALRLVREQSRLRRLQLTLPPPVAAPGAAPVAAGPSPLAIAKPRVPRRPRRPVPVSPVPVPAES